MKTHGPTVPSDQGNLEEAIGLYNSSLDFLLRGLKYEKDPRARAAILQRVEGPSRVVLKIAWL
jgi:hypothetical protein